MQNYFNYFTEIESHFQRRRGSLLMLSTLDWALIETWRDAGIPLEAVLRGIDEAFDKHQSRNSRPNARPKKINGLAWAAQSVMHAAQTAVEAATGTHTPKPEHESGFEPAPVAAWLTRNAQAIEKIDAPTATRLRTLANDIQSQPTSLEDLDRTLTVLEEKLFAAILASAPEEELTTLKAQADRELAPYRARMQAVQIRQIQQQFLQKRLLEARSIPRLSLFYMPHA
jgi:hypothetical protein